jgi:hypothetical protein
MADESEMLENVVKKSGGYVWLVFSLMFDQRAAIYTA